jgi:ABC-type multidrug transport system ATPase subunit
VHAKDRNAVPIRRAGVAFKNLTASGIGADTDFQKTIFNAPLAIVPMLRGLFGKQGSEIKILDNFAGLVRAGEMLVVLGPPGSGCSTFLKTIAGETHGFSVSEDSYINYQGIGPKQMHTQFRGEAIYTAEVEVHFPSLTVGQTLAFAAEARAPRKPLSGLTRRQYAEHARDVIMAVSNVVALLNIGTDYLRI